MDLNFIASGMFCGSTFEPMVVEEVIRLVRLGEWAENHGEPGLRAAQVHLHEIASKLTSPLAMASMARNAFELCNDAIKHMPETSQSEERKP